MTRTRTRTRTLLLIKTMVERDGHSVRPQDTTVCPVPGMIRSSVLLPRDVSLPVTFPSEANVLMLSDVDASA